MDTLLISLHPRHSQNILSGKKTIELRKTNPRPVDKVFIYETLPTASIVGWFEVSRVHVYKSDKWAEKTDWGMARQKDLQLTREEILNYLGQKPGYGIVIRQLKRIAPIPLSRMREIGILPPQGYRYLNDEMIEKLGVEFNDR